MKTSVTDEASFSSHISTPDASYPPLFRDRTGCGMYCWFNLWPSCCCLSDLQPDRLFLVASTAALLHFCTELCCLEITPADAELVLVGGSSLTITCSGSGETTWDFKSYDVPYFQVENGDQSYEIVQSNSTTSVLSLRNVNWKHTGVYQCIDQHTRETKEVAIFVPGEACFVHLWLKWLTISVYHGILCSSCLRHNLENKMRRVSVHRSWGVVHRELPWHCDKD